MAKRGIVLSNGDGRVTFSDTGSIWYEDTNLEITGSEISASSLTLAGIAANKLMYVSGSRILPVVTGTLNKGALVWNSSTSQWSASSDIVEYYTGNAGGDISGTYGDSINPPAVVNISNVNSGTLRSFNGGTGAVIPVGSNILLKATSGSFTYISASAASSGSFLTATSQNGWALSPPAYQPDIRFYTSGSTGNTFTWTKPEGARFARVILQGAGGGGGGGAAATYNGAGGGSGGFTDIVIDLSLITSASVTASIGGNGGSAAGSGVSGDTTSFGSYTAVGGSGGGVGANSTSNGGAAGTGTTKNGGKGASSVTTAADTTYDMPSGGARGGSGAVGGTITSLLLNKNFGYNISSTGDDLSTALIPASGALGVASPSVPSRPSYGAGGAGGAINTAGGAGGHGYALIISW